MKVVMLSTRHGRGLTTASILLADMCSRALGVQCILAHTDAGDITMDRYLNLSRSKDPTMSIRQVYKLLEVNQINGEKLRDYTIKRGNLQIFDIYNPMARIEDDSDDDSVEDPSSRLLNMVMGENTRGVSFIDIPGEIYSKDIQDVISDGDFFIIVIDQSEDNIQQLLEWQKYEYWQSTVEKAHFLVLVNNFNNNIKPLDTIAKELNIRRSNIVKIGYNPLIVKQANEGTLNLVNDYALNGDPRYANIKTDLIECVNILAQNLCISIDKKALSLNG